jgi:hypothetical protein
LVFIELNHVCPERRRRGDPQLPGNQRSCQNSNDANDGN